MTKIKRKFGVTLTLDATLELDDEVLSEEQLKDAAECLDGGGILSVEQAVQHLAYNMIANGLRITSIDGFANLPKEAATCDWSGNSADIDVVELES